MAVIKKKKREKLRDFWVTQLKVINQYQIKANDIDRAVDLDLDLFDLFVFCLHEMKAAEYID